MADKSPQERSIRVRRLKKIIIAVVFTAILIPIILSVILVVRLVSIRGELDELKQKVYQLEQAKEERDKAEDSALRAGSMTAGSVAIEAVASVEILETDKEDSHFKKVYLTFDDGPSDNTNAILDILQEYDVKASFFVVGKVSASYDAVYKRIVEQGHTLGIHSYSHKYDEIYASLDNYKEDFNKLRIFLQEKTGVDPKFYRFPGGSSNTVSRVDMRDLMGYLEEEQITFFDWNVESGDTTSGKISADQLVENCMSKINRYESSMVLMHDAGDKDTTVEALPVLIEKILALDNTQILPITDKTKNVQHITNAKQ